MCKNVNLFHFFENEENYSIRTIYEDGQIYFAGSDVAKALGYARPSKAVQDHCSSKGVLIWDTLTKGGIQSLKFITEGNLYRLIMRSKKKEAERFEDWIVNVVLPEIRLTGGYNIGRRNLPLFFERMLLNANKTHDGYFSVIQEMVNCVHLRFESLGYQIPDHSLDGTELRPDTSVGMCFANYLKNYYPHLEAKHKLYEHVFLSGLIVMAREYPNELLLLFREFIDNIWIPEKARNYFKLRDPKALEYIPMLLPKKAG